MEHINLTYRIFRSYLKFWHDHVFYREAHIIGRSNVPPAGTPLMIVSNHQTCLNDPLGILFALDDRKTHFITRADVFELHPLVNRFLRAIGLLPAFRLKFEGAEALKKNGATFKLSEEALAKGETVMLFPEGGHQDKHFLGDFSFGYTRMAFEAAEMTGFEKEIFILPSCNHYSKYHGFRNQIMVRFGTPISLQPYYELYRTKPRTAQREVNALVRAQIESMMLDIRDLEHYGTLDYIRETYGRNKASIEGYDPDYLPARLISDQQLISKLEADGGTEELYRDFEEYRKGLARIKLDDQALVSDRGKTGICGELLLELLLFPLWLVSLWPALLMYWLPMPLYKRMHDPMFEGSFLFAINVLFIIPITYILTFVLEGIGLHWGVAFLHVLLLPFLCIFAWNYKEKTKQTFKLFRKVFLTDKEEVERLHVKRADLWKRVSEIVK